MRPARTIASALLVVVAGCVSSVEPRAATQQRFGLAPSRARADAPAPCVMEVPGTGIRVREIDGGIAVTFDTVARGHVGELRAAVRRFGEAVVHGHRGHHHAHLTRAVELARRFREHNGALPPLEVAVHDVGRGAVLELRAANARDVDAARTKLRAEIGVMQRGVCPLLDAGR